MQEEDSKARTEGLKRESEAWEAGRESELWRE